MLLTGWAAIALAIMLVSSTLYAYAKYRTVWDNINHIAVTDLGKRPPKYNNALNILLIGSDSRSGKNAKFGGFTPGQRSDTVMVVHVSPGRHRLVVMSFPRDSMVPVHQCSAQGGFGGQQANPGQVEQINATFADGGPACLQKTIEHTTHIFIYDYVQLDFTGFISVINLLGGVEVCLPVAIRPSYYDHLSLTAGTHLIKGYQALEFWRLREDFGLGSDLQRIQRDQLLMVALVQRILKSGMLHSPAKTVSVISAISSAHAITTDLNQDNLLHLATSMYGVSRKAIQFVEVPVIPYPPNANDWVEFDPAQAPKLFAAIAHDVKLPKIKKARKDAKGAAPKLLSTSKVSVQVLNGSGVTGIAGTTATDLTARGFHVLGSASAMTATGAPDFSYTKSVVEYRSAAGLLAAQTVEAQLGKVVLRQVSTVQAGTVTLVLGSDFTSLAAQPAQSVGNLAGQFNGYTGGTNLCKVTAPPSSADQASAPLARG